MAERILYPEFRDELETTKYPFGDAASLQTTGGAYTLDRDIFLDASLYPIGAAGRLYLSQIAVTAQEITLTLSDELKQVRATATFDAVSPPSWVTFADARGRPAGILISEPLRLARFGAWASGTYTFAIGATEFAASCVIPTPEAGVRGLLTAKEELLANDVWLVGRNGVVLRFIDDMIRVDVVGDPLYLRQLCGALALFTTPLFIQTINGCPPDRYGNYNLTVGGHLNAETVLRVYPAAGGLVIEAIGSPVTGTRQ